METLISSVTKLLNRTLSPDGLVVGSATAELDQLSLLPDFPFSLIAIATGGENQGLRVAAATYLKNFTRRHVGGDGSAKVSIEFRNRLVQAALQAEPSVLKNLIEAFRIIIANEFVKENCWPELVPELRSAIQNSNIISGGANLQWQTVNALMILQALVRPFQYFLNPQIAKETVPPQLELIATDILVPLLSFFHQLVEKVLSTPGRTEMEIERILLIICKCIYFAVRSYMPSALVPILPSFCLDLFRVLGSLSLDGTTSDDTYMIRLKTGKRSLLICCSLVTRHRKHSDKLMPSTISCASEIVKQSNNIYKLDFLSERIISLGFDVLAHILETGLGWRLISPHFPALLDSAIFPALTMNQKDISEWEEDSDEYIRKNLPSDLDEISGWKDDLFTARKSAINLLGVISMAKGPPMVNSSNSSSVSAKRKKGDKSKRKAQQLLMGELLVLPFLSKFPVPSSGASGDQINNYYGVLMAYGGLQDLLRERNPVQTSTLLQTRVLPLYSSPCLPYLLASANWVLGELASCLPDGMSADVYASLLKALTMLDVGDISCYPVRASAAGAIAELLENDILPSDWLALLQVVVNNIDNKDDSEASILFQLLCTVLEMGSKSIAVHIPHIVSTLVIIISKRLPPIPEPWPQVVERGFAALAVMAQTWEDSAPEEAEMTDSSEEWRSGQVTITRAFSYLLQQAWLKPKQHMEEETLPPSSCIDDASKLLEFIVRSVAEANAVSEMKLSELLIIWAGVIADWHAWEELEDLSIFKCIPEVVNLSTKFELKNFTVGQLPLPPAPPVPQPSIIEGIGEFVSGAISQYPSATWKACSCVHFLLHIPTFPFEADSVKQNLVFAFSQAAFSHFREIQSKPGPLWKPLILIISSCYLCYPDIVERVLEKVVGGGFKVWASAVRFISSSSFEPALSAATEVKLIVMVLVKVVERLLGPPIEPDTGLLHDCFLSLMEATVRLKEIEEEEENEDDEAEDVEIDEDEETDDDEESEDDEHEETEEEFMDRYAKAALDLESTVDVDEGDVEDQDQELELGVLGEVDHQRAVFSLIERHYQLLVKGQIFPSHLITGLQKAFPDYAVFF